MVTSDQVCQHTNLAYLVAHQAGCHATHCLLPRPSGAEEDGMRGGQVLQGWEHNTAQLACYVCDSLCDHHSAQHSLKRVY